MKKSLLIGTLVVTLLTGCSNKQAEMAIPPPPIELIRPETHSNELMTCLVDPSDLEPVFELSDYERWVVECMVMGEAGGESWDGKVLVAQCILNACLIDGLQPSEVRYAYQYSGWNTNPSNEVKTVVTAVFNDGHTVTDEPILWFYAYEWCVSNWHESQRHIITEGGHKFFAPWEEV